jgi:hypothetical protein
VNNSSLRFVTRAELTWASSIFNRGRLESNRVEGVRDSYPEQKKLNEKIVAEGWDVVSPVNARQEAWSGKGRNSRGVAREEELGEVVEEPAEAELEPGFRPRRTPRLPVDDENLKAIPSISNVAQVRKGFAQEEPCVSGV